MSRFEEHLHEVFGDGANRFSDTLREHLHKLWELGQEKPDPGHTPLHWGTENDVQMQERLEDAAVPSKGKRKLYPATIGFEPAGWGAPLDRDRTRPPCRDCGGRGLGDYPFPCHSCNGTGNG